MNTVTWYARRLRTMSVREIAWRASQGARARVGDRLPGSDGRPSFEQAWSATDLEDSLHRFRSAGDRAPGDHNKPGPRRPTFLDAPRAARIAATYPGLVTEVCTAADAAAQLRVQYFGYPAVRLATPVDWNHDPVGDIAWPVRPASTIDHRTFDGDPKWIWELNRLQHLPLLAQAWLFTGDDRYARACFDQLDSWIDQNPPGIGIAWRGAFEAGVRGISVAVAVSALRTSPDLTDTRYRAVLGLLEASARMCLAHRSRFSSANNHLVGELAGLAVIAILFPDLPGAREWETTAVAELETQARLQILPDGVGAEQAVGYQIFTAELLAVVAALLVDRDGRAPRALTDAIARGADFLATVGEPAPRFGDDDEGFALRLGGEPLRTVAHHLDLARALLPGDTALRQGPASTPAGAWFAEIVAGGDAVPIPSTTAVRGPGGSAYLGDGGLVVLRTGRQRVTVDVAPLGYLSIAAHGHADALAITLAVDGREVIGDPGTGSYYGTPDRRTAMRSTTAHATVTVDDRDQSDMGGAFLWTRHARTRVRAVDLERGVVDAEHHGYADGRDPVVHRRWVIAPAELGGVLVVDLVSGTGRHTVATTWPLHPDLDAVACAGGYEVRDGRKSVALVTTAATVAVEPYARHGDKESHRGWWSRRLEQREPAWWVGARSAAESAPVVLATFIDSTGTFGIVYEMSVAVRDGNIVVEQVCEGVRRLGVIDTLRDGHVELGIETSR